MSMKRNWKSPRLLRIWERSHRSETPFKQNSLTLLLCWQQYCTYRVKVSDTDVLDEAVECHELEHTEGGDESSTPLSVKATNTVVISPALHLIQNVSLITS